MLDSADEPRIPHGRFPARFGGIARQHAQRQTPGSGDRDDQTPLRAELFSVEQMERHGKVPRRHARH